MRMRYVLAVLCMAMLLLPSVYSAAGASPPSVQGRTFSFSPGLEQTWKVPVHGADKLDVSITGTLAPYVVLNDPDPDGGPRTVEYTIKWSPDADLLPGDHYFFLRVAEAVNEGMVGTQAVVNIFHVGQYYTPEPYLVADMKLGNIEEGEKASAKFSLKSYSTNPIQNVRVAWKLMTSGTDEVLLSGNNLLMSELPSLAEEEPSFFLATESLPPGKYDVRANLTYDGGEPKLLEGSFRIGQFTANLLKSPKVIYRGKINKVSFTVYNAWNLAIPDARFSITIPELEIEEEAPVKRMSGFSQEEFIVYVEPAQDAELKNYEGVASLRLGVEDRAKTVTMPFTVEVRDPADDVEAAAKQVVTERPGAFSITLNPLFGAYILVFLLVLVNLYFLMKQNKQK